MKTKRDSVTVTRLKSLPLLYMLSLNARVFLLSDNITINYQAIQIQAEVSA